MKKLIVATGNPGKLKEMQAYLEGLEIELQLKPKDLEIEETGKTFVENAGLKASQVALATGEWAIADDSGLAVDALKGAPGLYSARYAATEADCIVRLLKELGDTPNRNAQFVCAVVVARPDGSIAIQYEGICQGTITHQPVGTRGFGYDPIFYVPEFQMTFAQMPAELKHEISHRGRAFQGVLPQLQALGNKS